MLKLHANRLLIACLTGLSCAAQSSQYEVSGSLYSVTPYGTGALQEYDDTGAPPLSNGFSVSGPPTTPGSLGIGGNSYASIDGSGLHASSDVTVGRAGSFPNSTGYYTLVCTSAASANYGDFVVSGPGGAPLSVRYRVQVDGVQSARAINAGDAPADSIRAASNVGVILSANSFSVLGAGRQLRSSNGGPFSGTTETGGFESFNGQATLTSDLFSVTPGTSFSLGLQLTATTSAVLQDVGRGDMYAGAAFGNTLSFVQGGPVFALPDGYTVNSPSAHIVNNRFVPVPEPGTFAALGFGAAALVRRRRRSRWADST